MDQVVYLLALKAIYNVVISFTGHVMQQRLNPRVNDQEKLLHHQNLLLQILVVVN
jgi:hypothetical protein